MPAGRSRVKPVTARAWGEWGGREGDVGWGHGVARAAGGSLTMSHTKQRASSLEYLVY